ncbi:MAG: tetratricopeptide repeat protein [Candidatus Zixiibacteriota bacterium]
MTRITAGMLMPRRRIIALWLTLALVSSLGAGCVYFNTFYHAKKAFGEGEKVRKQAGRQGGIAAGKNNYERAIEKANKIVEKHKDSKYYDDALFLIGVSYFRIGNYTKSEAAFRELLATQPDSKHAEESHLFVARCRIEMGDPEAGFRAFTELASTARKESWRAEAHYQRGVYFRDNEKYDSAFSELNLVFTEYKGSERALEARLLGAEVLREMGRYDEAIAMYRGIPQDDKDPLLELGALRGVGETFYESGQPDSGIAVFTSLLDREEFADSLGPIRLSLARGLQDLGDYDAAWRQYQQVAAVLERTTWSAEAFFRMAEIKQFQEEDLVTAKEMYDRSREESVAGPLAKDALTRSANISKLEKFRIDLGRGELTRPEDDEEYAYDPAHLPRRERDVQYSPLSARPPEFALGPPMADSSDSSDAAVSGASTASEAGAMAAPMASATAAPAEMQGPPADLAPIVGPPVDAAELRENARRQELLPFHDWWVLAGPDSALGPPSPAHLYPFGHGALLGPERPPDSVLASFEFAGIDTTALRIEAERDSVRAARKAELDEIRTAASTQMQLAELYRSSLALPDSALVEYSNLAARYPNTPFAAKALLGAADVLAQDLGDTAAANRNLREILKSYPYSDYAGEAIERLLLRGTAADTAHPGWAYRRAERFYVRDDNPRRAIEELEKFIDNYPESRLVANAEFAVTTLREMYFPPADSSVVLAYQEIQSDRPNTPFAEAASEKLTFTVARPKRKPRKIEPDSAAVAAGEGVLAAADSSADLSLPLAPRPKVAGEFRYPESEIGRYDREMVVVFKILIDFTGQISEYQMVQGTESEEINENARLAILGTSFDADSIPLDSLNMSYRYDVRVIPPARERDEFDRLGIQKDPTRR